MGPMREESGQQPQALPPLGKSSRDGEPQLNPDSWRKIRKTAAIAYILLMFEFCLPTKFTTVPENGSTRSSMMATASGWSATVIACA